MEREGRKLDPKLPFDHSSAQGLLVSVYDDRIVYSRRSGELLRQEGQTIEYFGTVEVK